METTKKINKGFAKQILFGAARTINTYEQKKQKLTDKIDVIRKEYEKKFEERVKSIQEECDELDALIDIQDKSAIDKYGFHTMDLVRKVTTESGGTSWELRFPDTIVPPIDPTEGATNLAPETKTMEEVEAEQAASQEGENPESEGDFDSEETKEPADAFADFEN